MFALINNTKGEICYEKLIECWILEMQIGMRKGS